MPSGELRGCVGGPEIFESLGGEDGESDKFTKGDILHRFIENYKCMKQVWQLEEGLSSLVMALTGFDLSL